MMLFKHKWFMILSVLLSVFIVAGCAANDKSDSDSQTKEETQKEETKNESAQSTTKLESDADLEKQLEAETGIESVMVQVVEGDQKAVNVDIAINNEQKLSADEVVEKYSDVIKEKYPDRKIDIIVVKEGTMLKQVTLE